MATTNKLPEGSTWEQFKLEDVKKDTTVTVTFAPDVNDNDIPDKYEKVTVSGVSDGNGSISPEKKIITPGEDVVLTITPKAGYVVDTITVDDTVYVNDPNFGKAYVEDSQDIVDAINNPSVESIVINAPVSMSAETQINRPMTIDGNGNTITQSSTGKTFTMTADSTVENVKIESTADNTDWHSSYGVQFYTGTHAVKDSTFTGGNAAMIVNGATVNLEGTIDVSGNTFGGIEVCKGTNPDLGAGVLNIGDATIVNQTEEYGKPTIWIDGNTDAEGVVTGADDYTVVEVAHGDTLQKHFYKNAANSKPIRVGDDSYDTLADAIANANGATISLGKSLTEDVTIPAGSTIKIEGNGHTLTGMITLPSGEAGDHTSLEVSDLTFEGAGSKSWAILSQNQTATAGQSSASVTLTDCQIQNYTKKGIYATELDSLTLSNCAFVHCATDEMNDPNTYGDYVVDLNLMGVKDADIEIQNCVFRNNGAQKASVKVTQRGGESDEGAGDVPEGIETSVDTFNLMNCTFEDSQCDADIQIGTDNKSASTNPDAGNTTGAFGAVSIFGNTTETKIKTAYDSKSYVLEIGQSFTKTGSQEPVVQ